MPKVRFAPADREVEVPEGTLILEAAQACGVNINVPCGGQGRCGRCAVVVTDGDGVPGVRRRSVMRLSAADIAAGYALACQSAITGDLVITVPPQEEIARHLVTEKTAVTVEPPAGYRVEDQPLQAFYVVLEPPHLGDQTDDWARLQSELARSHDLRELTADLSLLRDLGGKLRAGDWEVTAIVETDAWDRPHGPPRLVDVLPGRQTDLLHSLAIDIGTTTVSLYLVDLMSGQVLARSADYNAQVTRGEDIISRIIYASQKPKGTRRSQNGHDQEGMAAGEGSRPAVPQQPNLMELQRLVVGTVNKLIHHVCRRRNSEPDQIYKATVAGNPTMLHLFLGIPPESIRLAPYIPAVNHVPSLVASAPELGLDINPRATVDCLPGVASYVGADISSGVLSSGLHRTEALNLFIDVGTNGEMVLGNADWLITCACSAGPAFEGAGVQHGMRATAGAIEEVWINAETKEPTYRTIGSLPPKGLCGSGLISLLAEMFITGVVDKSGNVNLDLYDDDRLSRLGELSTFKGPRVRQGEHGEEYVVAWGEETADGRDIVITKVDIDNLLRAKAAIFAGFSTLAQAVGVELGMVEDLLIGGSFGQHINVEKAVEIGLLPDLPSEDAAGEAGRWERFKYLGNTSLRGAYYALVSRQLRQEVRDIAGKMTYLELSADNAFYDQFTSALFLPHTDIEQFPTVKALLEDGGVTR
jgi:uncharacterized 2Fe-2S/4Fe-4S cluster protein (DUF4445 family)